MTLKKMSRAGYLKAIAFNSEASIKLDQAIHAEQLEALGLLYEQQKKTNELLSRTWTQKLRASVRRLFGKV